LAQGAQLLDNLGDYSRTITTSSPDAQAYFNQGLRLIYAFNHDEAVRAFAKAIELDPACAMCYWGAGESPDRTTTCWQCPTAGRPRQAVRRRRECSMRRR
jgi:tetratricopeptide (TPR) repeat protein